MTRKKKSRLHAGRVPLEMLPETERQRRTSLSKRKPKQRSVYDKMQDDEPGSEAAQPSSQRRSRLKHDPKAIAEQSRQLLDTEQDESTD